MAVGIKLIPKRKVQGREVTSTIHGYMFHISTDQVAPQAITGGKVTGDIAINASGSYTGDGTADRQITTGFKCSFVIIQTSSASNRFTLVPSFTIRDTGAADNLDDTTNTYLHASDGFVVGSNSNTDGNTYYYWAVKE